MYYLTKSATLVQPFIQPQNFCNLKKSQQKLNTGVGVTNHFLGLFHGSCNGDIARVGPLPSYFVIKGVPLSQFGKLGGMLWPFLCCSASGLFICSCRFICTVLWFSVDSSCLLLSCQVNSAQRLSWTSWDTLECWRLWRSGGLGTLSADNTRTSLPGDVTIGHSWFGFCGQHLHLLPVYCIHSYKWF